MRTTPTRGRTTRTPRHTIALLAACAALLMSPAWAQEESFKELIEAGKYEALGEKLRTYLDMERADPKLRRYLELNLEYLARGAKGRPGGEEVILFRGAKNDNAYRMPASSGGEALMLPNTIRYQRRAWDARLNRIKNYFTEATTKTGGNGRSLHELDRIMEHHKGGGLGTNANSVKSVLISTSTRPISHFGPPYYIIKVPAERAIFNPKGLSGEYEVLLPFWVLPTEIVAKVETFEELKRHPLYEQSKFKDLRVSDYGYGAGGGRNNWELIEDNIRNGRPPLEGLTGLNSYFAEGTRVGRAASPVEVGRFATEVARRGGLVEMVERGDPRLPEGSQARTYLHEGKPKVLLRAGEPVPSLALTDELTHVEQLRRMLSRNRPADVETLLMRSQLGDPQAREVVNRWEAEAKRAVRDGLARNDPTRRVLDRSIRELEADVDQLRSLRRADGTIDWARATRSAGASLGHFTLALFLKELAVVAQTGDRGRIDEFFQGLLTTDFYVHYGLFTLGAAGGDTAYRLFLEKHLSRLVRPRFVQSILRSNVALAAGMALPELIGGRFDGRTFAIDLAGLGLSSTAVKAGASAIRWVTRLERLPGGLRVANTIARHARLAKVGGFLYTAAETAVVLYFGEKISQAIDAHLAEREARKAVRDATAALLRDPTGEGAREALEAVAEAHRAWRDHLLTPLEEGEARLMARLHEVAEDGQRASSATERARALLDRNSSSTALAGYVARNEARLAEERQAEVDRILAEHDAGLEGQLRELYGEPRAASAPTGAGALAELRGEPRGRSVFARLFDWRSGSVLDWSDDMPETRLASYDHEAALYDALAAAHAHDPLAAAEFARRADQTRELRDRDRALVLGDGPAARAEDEARDGALGGLNRLVR